MDVCALFVHTAQPPQFIHFHSFLIVGTGLSHCCILSGGDCKAWWSSSTTVQQGSTHI